MPIREARRIRNERKSKTLTQAESEAAICEGIIRFQEEYMGQRSEQFHALFMKDILLVRIQGALTQAERQLAKSSSPEKGRDLIKQVRKQLLETGPQSNVVASDAQRSNQSVTRLNAAVITLESLDFDEKHDDLIAWERRPKRP